MASYGFLRRLCQQEIDMPSFALDNYLISNSQGDEEGHKLRMAHGLAGIGLNKKAIASFSTPIS